jgi:ornithine carbamoyltransferase
VNPPLHRQLLTQSPLDATASRALLDTARALRVTAERDAPLRGKNIALMCGTDPHGQASLVAEAAARLGARVARIEPAPSWLRGEAQPGADTARLLEHLYDAVDCEALPPALRPATAGADGRAVYDGLASADHPLFGLVRALAPSDTDTDATARRLLVQAALVTTLL